MKSTTPHAIRHSSIGVWIGCVCAFFCPDARAEDMGILLERQIAEIRSETTEDTLRNLNLACTQCWLGRTPGEGAFLAEIPLGASAGAGEIFAVYRERRFLKLLDELQAAPARAGEMLSAELSQAVREHAEMFNEMVRIQGALDPGAISGGTANGPVFILDPEPEEPTILGARHKVFAILALVGALRPTGVRAAVEEAVEAAIAQRNWCYEDEKLTEGFRLSALAMAGTYNRQILGAALLATRSDSGEIMEKLQNRAIRWTESEPVTRFDELTVGNPSAPAGLAQAPPGESARTFPVLEPLGDAQFDLLRELAQAEPAK